MKTENYKIICNKFTREYQCFDKNGVEIQSSQSNFRLTSHNEYLKYVYAINNLNTVYYNITKNCNFRCNYCYSVHDNTSVSLAENEIILKKLLELNTRTITLIGGEPFCHPKFYDILQSCVEKAQFEEICIVTNGSLIDKEKIDVFRDQRIQLQISIDGINEESNAKTRGTGNFEKVYKNILFLEKEKIKIRLMKVLTRENISDSKEFYDFFHKQGIQVGFFMVKQVDYKLKPTTKQLENLLNYIYEKEFHNIFNTFHIVNFADNMMFDKTGFPIMHCGAGINALSILPNGNVYPCVKMESTHQPITNIFSSEALNSIRENRKTIIKSQLVINKPKCKECSISFFCGGGCRAEEVQNTPCSYNCEYFKFAVQFFISKIPEIR